MTTSTALTPTNKSTRGVTVPGFGEELDLRALVQLINRRKTIIIQTTIAVIVFGMLLAFILPPRYDAHAIVMLDTRRTRVTNMEQVVSNLGVDAAVVRSEMDVLKSRAMAGRVVDKLGLINDPNYNKNAGPSWFSWLHVGGSDKAARAAEERTAVIDEVLEDLEIDNDGKSYAINILFSAGTPGEAARIANAFADAYLVDQLEAKYEGTERANKWLSERLQNLRLQVEASEKAVADFRKANNLTEVTGSTTITAQQLGEINSQLVTARAERSQAEARLRSAQSMVSRGSAVDAAGDVLSSELIQRLREQESQVRREMAEMSTRYGERHPRIIIKRAELRDLQGKIGEEVQRIVQSLANEVEVAKAKENSLSSELARLEGKTSDDSQATVTLRQLEREADANKSLYESFLTRFKQTSEQVDLQQADSRIIARAEPPIDPAFPSPLIFFLVSVVLGAGGGILVAYLIEYFDRGFRGAVQIEQATGFPAIGLVPSLRGTTEKTPEDYVVEKPLSSYSEALRGIRTAIHFSNVDKPPKIVMFTSALPNEGKSTLCMSMCRSLALAGNKVLLIEADLRRPRLRRALKGNAQAGDIAQLVAGDKPLSEVLQIDKPSGMHYIVAHTGTPSPQDLLGSQQMERLLRSFATQYDLVVVDTPPIMAVSDAAVLGKVVDCCVFTVRWAETPREVATQAIKQLASMNVRLAGVVLSQVDLDAHAKYGYGDQGYYYGRYREYYSN